ncbi:MAG: GNAT family N-acetyltransferase [Cellulosilyticaceae bacterium]
MINTISYRPLDKKDYPRIKSLISEAFGFGEFIQNPKLLDAILTIYLQSCILESSFSKVAVKNNQVIGIILGHCKEDKHHLSELHNYLSCFTAGSKLVLAPKADRQLIKEFSKVQKTYKEIIQGKEDHFQGCIQLFIVAGESRGLGVGKTLVAHLLGYMKKMNVHSFYLYTDNRCNYGFYDSHNFKRLNTKTLSFTAFPEQLQVYLYGYQLN